MKSRFFQVALEALGDHPVRLTAQPQIPLCPPSLGAPSHPIRVRPRTWGAPGRGPRVTVHTPLLLSRLPPPPVPDNSSYCSLTNRDTFPVLDRGGHRLAAPGTCLCVYVLVFVPSSLWIPLGQELGLFHFIYLFFNPCFPRAYHRA